MFPVFSYLLFALLIPLTFLRFKSCNLKKRAKVSSNTELKNTNPPALELKVWSRPDFQDTPSDMLGTIHFHPCGFCASRIYRSVEKQMLWHRSTVNKTTHLITTSTWIKVKVVHLQWFHTKWTVNWLVNTIIHTVHVVIVVDVAQERITSLKILF